MNLTENSRQELILISNGVDFLYLHITSYLHYMVATGGFSSFVSFVGSDMTILGAIDMDMSSWNSNLAA